MQMRAHVSDANAQHVGNTLWALGQLGHQPSGDLLPALLDRSVTLLTVLVPSVM